MVCEIPGDLGVAPEEGRPWGREGPRRWHNAIYSPLQNCHFQVEEEICFLKISLTLGEIQALPGGYTDNRCCLHSSS